MNDAQSMAERLRTKLTVPELVSIRPTVRRLARECEEAADLIEQQAAEIERLHTERRRLLRQIGTEQDQPSK